MTRHHYTYAEVALVREMWPTHTAPQIAERIHGTGRAAKSIYALCHRLGLAKHPRHPDSMLETVRRECAVGGTDATIARRLGLTREQVTHLRHRLGIPRDEAAVLDARRQGVRTQRVTLGIGSAGQLRALSYRRYAVENGWPDDLRPREVQILNALAARGVPMSRLELAEAIGMRTDRIGGNGRPSLLVGNGRGGTYTAALLRRGLLICLPRACVVHGRGRGASRNLYALSPAALSILAARAALLQGDAPCPLKLETATVAAPCP